LRALRAKAKKVGKRRRQRLHSFSRLVRTE
jgi:hypothetical protein